MYRLAVIGESDSVLAFKAVGFDTFLVSPGDAEHKLKEQYHSGRYAVIFLSETLAKQLEEELHEFDRKPFPAIGVLPLGKHQEHVGYERMKKISIRATGTDILSKL